MDNPGIILDPTQHDFNELIKIYYEKLTDRNIITLFWNHLLNKESLNAHQDKLSEYRIHLPVDLYKYVKLLELKFSELPKENLQFIDGIHKRYLLTFIYFCTKKGGTITDKTKITISSLYLHLTILPEIGKLFFNKPLYMCQMFASIGMIKSHDINEEQKENFIKLVKRHCLQEEHLDNAMLAASANVIIVSMFIGASEGMLQLGTVTRLTACCMKALRIILLHVSSHTLIKIIARRLFRCMQKRYMDSFPNPTLVVDVLILFLKGTLRIRAFDRKIEPLLDSFTSHWTLEVFANYKAAVKVMNAFPEQPYKDLLRKMATLSESRCRKVQLINIFNLVREILCTPPNLPLEKISVLFSCVVGNVAHHILNNHDEVKNLAIDVLKEVTDATTNPLHKYLFADVRASHKLVKLPVDSLLLGISKAADPTWTPKNKKIFHIFTRFVAETPLLNPVLVENALNDIVRDANRDTFQDSLEALKACLLAASERNETEIAESFMAIVHKFALFPNDNFGFVYARTIFFGMLIPSEVDGKVYSPKCYYNVYLTSSFKYEGLFRKCKCYIGQKEVTLSIKNLDYKEPCSAILLCNLLEHCHYTDLNILAPYILEHFSELSEHLTIGYVCEALEKILRNQSVSDFEHPVLDAIQCSIMAGLFLRTFHIQSLKLVYSLYKLIREILQLPDDRDQLDQLLSYTARQMLNKLHTTSTRVTNCVLYLNELCLLINSVPGDALLLMIQNCLDNTPRMSAIQSRMPDIYIETLTLLCTFAMVNKNKVHLPLRYLTQTIYSDDIVIKVLSIKLLYGLCREITHEYSAVIKFSFETMVVGNLCLIRICSGILEELIHEDFIKLDSENFYRIVYPLGCDDLKEYVGDLLLKRFVLSNQNDITKYYMQTVMYTNTYGKFSSYRICSKFHDELERINKRICSSTDILEFLFLQLPISKKINILMEIVVIFEDLMRGQCKVDTNFFNVMLDLFVTVKLMRTREGNEPMSKCYYQNVMKMVEKQIIRLDPDCKKEQYYKEFETEIKKCTIVMMKLLFFENQQLASKIQYQLFDALMNWIDFIKGEIIYYIHEEKGKEYDPYFTKLVLFYNKNKNMFDNYAR